MTESVTYLVRPVVARTKRISGWMKTRIEFSLPLFVRSRRQSVI